MVNKDGQTSPPLPVLTPPQACPPRLGLSIARVIGELIDAVIDPVDEPAVHHLASCLGLIRAAGILGVRFGTLPYSEKLVDRCIVRSYRVARRALRTESQLLRSGLRRLRAKLKSSNLPTVARKGQPRADDFKMARLQ
jgi:hypothetical protein